MTDPADPRQHPTEPATPDPTLSTPDPTATTPTSAASQPDSAANAPGDKDSHGATSVPAAAVHEPDPVTARPETAATASDPTQPASQLTPEETEAAIVADIRRAAQRNERGSMLFLVVGVALAVFMILTSLNDLSWRLILPVLLLVLLGLRWWRIVQMRPLARITGLRSGRLESVERRGVVVRADDGTRLLLAVRAPRRNTWTAQPGEHVRVTDPFREGLPVAVVFDGPDDVEGLLALPLEPARAA